MTKGKNNFLSDGGGNALNAFKVSSSITLDTTDQSGAFDDSSARIAEALAIVPLTDRSSWSAPLLSINKGSIAVDLNALRYSTANIAFGCSMSVVPNASLNALAYD